MATAKGAWIATSNINAGFIDLARRGSKEITEDDLIAFNQRNHHYTFDVDHKGLDINGFILHTDKHKGKRQKFRDYLDSNENGRFDKNDQLIGRTGLKHKHAAKGVGNLLDEDEVGQLEVKFTRHKSNASMKSDENADNATLFSVNGLIFCQPDDGCISWIGANPYFIKADKVNTFSASKALSTSSTSYMDDPEWQKMWQKYCTGDAKPPYPEDCFFGYPYS